jgi:hypothetical protein
MATNIGRRFEELLKQAETIDSGKRMEGGGQYSISGYRVDGKELLKWIVNVRHLISSACGADSEHFKLFLEAEKSSMYTTNHEIFERMKAVFLAAKEDYDGGYLHKIRDLIQAEVFDSELEQAEELLATGYHAPAAVVAGVVLETRLRQLCQNRGIPAGNLNKMNTDLTKAGVYNTLTQKQITVLADIRNSAAHGEIGKFTQNDVTNMVRDVRDLLAGRLS